MRPLRSPLLALLVTLLPLVPAPAGASSEGAPSSGGAPGDAGLLGTGVRGTGVLPNFRASGRNLIRLQVGAFDPLRDAPPSPPGIGLVDAASLPDDVAQYWLVQVRDQRFADVTRAVNGGGALVAGFLPDSTYMVRATPAQAAAIATHEAVRWSGYYQPAWRVPVAAGGLPGLFELEGTRTYRVHVFAAEPRPGAVARALRGMSGVDVVDAAGTVVDVRATASEVAAIASLPAVEWVAIKPRAVPMNANARWVNDTGVRDVYAATAPGRLDGTGQTAAVADTGLNYTYDLNGRAHVAFRDCDADGTDCKEAIYTQANPGDSAATLGNVVDNGTNHRKMVAYFDLGNAGPNMFDPSSHGTHVAGSVNGDQPPFRDYTGEDGLAPGAMHVHQNIATPSGSLGGLPGDLYDLFRQAYRPRDPNSVDESSPAQGNVADYTTAYRPLEDARTHNNSWGYIFPLLDPGDAARLDQFIWDHEDMVVSISAGNSGPAPGTIGSPSTSKNNLSSGASANGRQPMVSIDSMAQFSSHGPTGDGRFGPDVATPGQVVVSSKGGTVDGYHTAQGTSMSSPVLTGLATLVRQYFWDGFGPGGGKGFAGGDRSSGRRHNPSAALVKATLVNGAERMRGFYTGDDGNDPARDGQWPSAGQGFGRVDLDNSLYFSGDPANNWYHDVYRNDDEAFPVSVAPAAREYTVHVEPGQPLDVTLAWTDAPNVLPAGSPARVNNLDLVVEGPGGTYVGNNMNSRVNPGVEDAETFSTAASPDTQNLVERVRVLEPEPGDYTITVQADPIAMGNQGFALAASGVISGAGGGAFAPGPPLQADQPGGPNVSNVRVRTISADTARITFSTNEPTTAVATVDLGGTATTFEDSYNEDPADGGFPGLNEDPRYIETSDEYADKLVVGTEHEILLTGLLPGETYGVELTVTDLGDNGATVSANVATPTTAFQPQPGDIAQCVRNQPDCAWAGLPHDMPPRPVGPSFAAPPTPNDNYATQMYASQGSGYLGAFMFRLPEGAVDSSRITGAAVEMTSSHNWVVPYTQDPVFTVDLLPESFEGNWRSRDYRSIHGATPAARAYPETTHKRGAYYDYAFTFRCGQMQRLRDSLANGQAAFRWDSDGSGLFAMDIGFNRRSRGPDLRPRLLLFTDDGPYPNGRGCDAGTPAPAISDVGVHEGLQPGSMTVSWDTDVDSDSVVLFREQGQSNWTQVGTPALTRVHHVQVHGLDPEREYEFAVRSAACNGATTTDTNGGAGYGFFRDPPDPGPRTEHASYDWETDAEGWTVVSTHPDDPLGPSSDWERRSGGASDDANPDGSRDRDSSKTAWHVEPYFNQDETSLVSPPVTFGGPTAAVEFALSIDTEPEFDFLYVEYSSDPASTEPEQRGWTTAATFDGQNENYPAFDPTQVRFKNPGGELQVRFRFDSDFLISTIDGGYQGVVVDKAAFASYANPLPPELPLTGPVPPPSAQASGLTPPPTRTTPAAADLSAGTGYCAPVRHQQEQGQEQEPPTPERCPGYREEQGNHVVGTPGDDVLDGTSDRDIICGLGGDDLLRGFAGNDILDGGNGDDRLRGRAGRDRLVGGAGEDYLGGAVGKDRLSGGTENDVLRAGKGNDVARGGRGNDDVRGHSGKDRLRGNAGEDGLRGGSDNDDLRAGGGDDVLHGGAGTDSCSGGGGANTFQACERRRR